MRLAKYFILSLAIFFVLLGGTLGFLFSSSGNKMVQGIAENTINEQKDIGAKFETFRFSFGDFEFVLVDKLGSKITVTGTYSFIPKLVKAEFNADVKEVGAYENLIGKKLNGKLSASGDIEKRGEVMGVNALISAFDSRIAAKIDLEDFKPENLKIVSDNINIASLLHFADMPKLAKGIAMLDVDMDISNPAQAKGGYKILSNGVDINSKVLAESYGVTIPADKPLKIKIIGKSEGKKLQSDINIDSEFLNVASKDFTTNLDDNSLEGIVDILFQNVGYERFVFKERQKVTLGISGKIGEQKAFLKSDIFGSDTEALLNLVAYDPKTVDCTIKKIQLGEVISFLNMDYDAQGSVDLKAKIEGIDLKNKAFSINTALDALFSKIVVDGKRIASNVKLQGNIQGDEKEIEAKINTDLFDSKTIINAAIKNLNLDSIEVDSKGLDIAHLAALSGYKGIAKGNLNTDVKLRGIKEGNINGNATLVSSNIKILKNDFNKKLDMALKNDLALSIDSKCDFENGVGKLDAVLKNNDFLVRSTDALINIKDGSVKIPFLLDAKELSRVSPLKNPSLNGPLKVEGSFAKSGEKIDFRADTASLGGDFTAMLKDERAKIKGQNLEATKIANLLSYAKAVRGGVINMDGDVAVQGKDANEIKKNLDGHVLLKATKMELTTIDVDKVVQSFEKSNKIDLVDVGAFVVAGPLGTALTKGGDFGSLGADAMTKGSTLIKELNAQVDITKGFAKLTDVAFSTNKNRIAAVGGIDFKKDSFEDFSVAVLNSKGCATFKQEVKGTLSEPKIESTKALMNVALNLVGSLFAPMKNAASNAQEQCKTYYEGAVKHPTN